MRNTREAAILAQMLEIYDILQIRPGRVAALLPGKLADDVSDAAAVASIQAALQMARESRVEFVQALLEPENLRRSAWLKSCGFTDLTEVFYLVCPRAMFLTASSNRDVHFSAFDDSIEMRNRLCEVILHSYEGSRDCPPLNGLRKLPDILESYRAVGRYSPQHWSIVQSGRADAGCLLLAAHDAENELEIVYMGVVPQWRRRGLATIILDRAKQFATHSAVARLSLAVDAANRPALALYFAAGFELRARHRLFFRQI